MTLADWSTTFANNQRGLPTVYSWREFAAWRDGSPVDGRPGKDRKSTVFSVGVRTRTGKSSNKVVIIDGSPWRYSSGYGRSLTLMTVMSTETSKIPVNGGYNIVEGRPLLIDPMGDQWSWHGILMNSLDYNNMVNRVTTELLNKLTENSVNLGANILQSRQSIDELSGLASTVLNAYRGFRQRNLSAIKRAVLNGDRMDKALAERYLSWVYGIKPTLQDVHNSYNIVTKHISKSQLFSIHQSGSIGNSRNMSVNTVVPLKAQQNESIEYRAKIWCSLKSETLLKIAQFGLTNPASVLWEVTPWSFVVDWMVPVGQVLSALSAPQGFGHRGGSWSRRHSVSTVYTQNPGDSQFYSSVARTRLDVSDYTRVPITTFPIPGLFIKSPFSTTHVTNALALFRANGKSF